ncbi:MAG: hypothetical protein C0483_03315 [Pirellula sp.]|nr:hypothetical protein [Pirellula sp.]
MKYSTYSLPKRIAASWGVLLALVSGAASQQPALPAPPPAAAVVGPSELVDRSAAALSAHLSIVAKVRHRGRIYGRDIIGSGEYAQGPIHSRLLRYEIRMKVGERTVNLLQVCDDRYLWTSRQLEHEPEIQRVEIDRVLAALERQVAAQPTGAFGVANLHQAIAIGGLGQLLASLRKDFQFYDATKSQLGDLPVYVVSGKWKSEALGGFAASQPKGAKSGATMMLRPHVPNRVLLFLGADDLFPYRIEFRSLDEGAGEGSAAAPEKSADAADELLLAMELFEVQINVPLEERLFQFAPGSRPYTDVTDLYLQKRTALP